MVLGIWRLPEPALAFMRDIGAALTPDASADPDRMRDIYPGTPAASSADVTTATCPHVAAATRNTPCAA